MSMVEPAQIMVPGLTQVLISSKKVSSPGRRG